MESGVQVGKSQAHKRWFHAQLSGKLAAIKCPAGVPTGTFERFSRQEIQDAIRQAGGKPAGSVSKNTDFVVAGEKAGSKLDKARELEIEVIDEMEFMRRIGKN